VHIVASAPATEITAHNLLADGQGWSYFTGGGLTNNETFWTPYYQASWKVQSPGALSGASSVCYGGG